MTGASEIAAVAHAVAVPDSTRTVAWVMAGIMLAAFVVAKVWLPKDRTDVAVSGAAAAA